MVASLFLAGGRLLQEYPDGGFEASLHAAGAQPPQQEDEFVPVKDLDNQEQLPATPLVIAAYAVAWLAVFLYLWSIWRRLSRVEGEMASLSRRVADRSRPEAGQ